MNLSIRFLIKQKKIYRKDSYQGKGLFFILLGETNIEWDLKKEHFCLKFLLVPQISKLYIV
ncbi:hypothetical protein DWB61_16855 [Ancylomarina euxinus]|uniref:Uncharacterized protein n=1 Tax=Ancylomarina euxinus TaxID=2283627 RepID=A0A425XWU9_9BACT|nr:hypothetical protein DWB61_16855 [Ancylomarina euxinus]